MAGELYVSNLAGTFDYQSILDVYYQSQIQPVLLLQQQEAELDAKISAINDFQSLIDNMYSALNGLTDQSLIYEKSVSVSDETAITARIIDSTKAQPGIYTLDVKQLAKNDVWLSQSGVESTEDAPQTAAGTIEISYAGETVATIDYDEDTPLEDIVNDINSAQDKVRAALIYDGSSYRLLLTGADTGADNTISITETGDGDLLDQLEIGDGYSDSHVQVAQDAVVNLYGEDISSSTNTFSNVIPGLEFTVKEVASDVNISVENNYQPFIEQMESLISAYNQIVDFVQTEMGQDGRLSGEFTLQSIRSTILSKLQPLFDNRLVEVDKDTGHLILDSAKLEEMLKSDPESVQDLVNDLKDNLYDYLLYLKSPTGPIESMEDALENQKSSLEERIEDMQKLIMEQVEMFRQQLIQIQLLQEEMESLKAQLTSVFGTTTLLPQ